MVICTATTEAECALMSRTLSAKWCRSTQEPEEEAEDDCICSSQLGWPIDRVYERQASASETQCLWPGSRGSCEPAGFLCSPWHCAREGQNEARGGWPDACRYAHPQWQFKPCTMSISKTSKLLNYINYREWGLQHCALRGCKAAAGLHLKLFQADGDGVVQGCE